MRHDPAVDDDSDPVAFGPGQPGRFLTWWYGAASGTGTPGAAPTADEVDGLPAPLRAWHELAAARRLPEPVQLEVLDAETAWYDGDVLVVASEQGGWLWGVDAARAEDPTDDGGGDLPVLERSQATGGVWSATKETLTEFLWHAAVLEAVLGAPVARTVELLDGDAVRVAATRLRPVPVPWWTWPGQGHWLLAGDGVLVVVAPDDPEPDGTPSGTYFALGAARSPDAAAVLDGVGLAWS